MTSSFKIPIASWLSGEVSVTTQSDMRKNLGISKVTYTNNIKIGDDWEISNAINIGSNDFKIDNEISTKILNTIGVSASFEYDKNGFTNPSFWASTRVGNNTDLKFGINLEDGSHSTTVDTKFGRYNIGSTIKLGDNLISLSPHIGFKIYDDMNFSGSFTIAKEDDIVWSTNAGITYKFSNNNSFGVYFNTTGKNSDLSVT